MTWYTNDPDVTDCFQKTVLVWIPCIFLWTFSPLEAYYLLNSRRKNIPYTWIFLSKLILTLGLIVLAIIDLGMAIHTSTYKLVYSVDYCTPCINIASYVSIINFNFHRKNSDYL